MMKLGRMFFKHLFCNKVSYKANIWIEDKDPYENKNIHTLFD